MFPYTTCVMHNIIIMPIYCLYYNHLYNAVERMYYWEASTNSHCVTSKLNCVAPVTNNRKKEQFRRLGRIVSPVYVQQCHTQRFALATCITFHCLTNLMSCDGADQHTKGGDANKWSLIGCIHPNSKCKRWIKSLMTQWDSSILGYDMDGSVGQLTLKTL